MLTPLMRLRMPGWLIALACVFQWVVTSSADEGGVHTAEVAAAAAQVEALMAVPVLMEENDRLRGRIEQLDSQVSELTVQLAETRAMLDRLQVQQDQLPVLSGQAGEEVSHATPMGVVAVNRDLALVVVDGGSATGVKPGLLLAVLRNEQVVARVRVVDVRQKISGARIETVLGDVYPQQGDRVVVWRSSM